MKIRALKAFTIRDDSGDLLSIAHGGIAEVSSETGQQLMDDGLAEAYTLISPTGSISITENGTVDVTQYASATVNVIDSSLGSLIDRSITSITIPNGALKIGKYAFAYCGALTSVTIPDSVTSIEDNAFEYCTYLRSVIIPNDVSAIGSAAFHKCDRLETMTVNVIVPPTLGDGAIDLSSNLIIYVPAGSVETYKVADGWSDHASKIQAIPS